VNAAVEDSDSDSNKIFAFVMDIDSDYGSMPSLGDVTDLDWDLDEEDGKGLMPRLEMVSDCGSDSKELSGTDWSEISLLVSVDSDLDVATEDVAAHIGAGNNANEPPCVEVYNSGSTRHITPYRDAMEKIFRNSSEAFSSCQYAKVSCYWKGRDGCRRTYHWPFPFSDHAFPLHNQLLLSAFWVPTCSHQYPWLPS
jgi:hypothetical protein